MEIKELIEKKAELERNIEDLIYKFESETEVRVNSVEISFLHLCPNYQEEDVKFSSKFKAKIKIEL